ncbi:MAG: TRAP transporter small permease subunit [Deltaproteobacteria bacterium]|nr:MAG: TRAP transporter small permease subunit [Deltaproteobacteria bacterium]
MEKNKWLVFVKKIDAVSNWFGKIFSYLVLPLTALIVFEVITRRFFNAPTIWTFELSNFLFGAHFMLVAAYGLLYKAHVSIDLVSMRFSHRTQEKFQLFCYFTMFFPFIIIMLYHGTIFAKDAWAMKETSWSVWGPPLYPIKTVIPITALLLLLQGVSEVIKKITFLKTGETL